MHLVDVKVLMSAAFWTHGVCALMCCLAVALSWRPSRALAGGLLAVSRGCLGWVGLMVAIGLVAYANFGFFFTEFHHLLFEGDTWLFSPHDTLIQLFPVRFWIDATWLIALLTTSTCAIVGITAYALYRRLREIR